MLLAILSPAQAQVAINIDWQSQSGTPATEFDYSVSNFDIFENLYVAGNTVESGQAANFWLIKYDLDGNVLWETTVDFDNGDDYITSMFTDDQGNLFVAGPSFNVADSSFDFAVASLDSDGVLLWSTQYTGDYGKDDFPISIQRNASNEVFVTGIMDRDSTGKDYATMKLDATDGTVQWTQYYDHAGFDDIAVGLELDENDQSVTITGGSASTANSYDYATVKYKMSDGTQIQANRYVTGVQGYNSPVAVCKDDDGNILITGRAVGVSSFDIQTIKLDSTLSLQWSRTWDGHGLEDVGRDVKTDQWGNVYVAGYQQDSSLGFGFITIKYDQTGLLLWKKEWIASGLTDTAQTSYLALDGDNDVYITGSVQNGSTSYLQTVVYDTDGNDLWSMEYDTPGSAEGVPADLRVNFFGDVYLTGKTNSSTGNEFMTLKYEVLPMSSEYAYDSAGNTLFVRNELIIRFNPEVINTSFIDNLDHIYGNIGEIITDTSLISLMDKKLNVDGDFKNWKMLRVYSNFKTTMTKGVSIPGDTIDIPPLWSTFVLMFPKASSSLETSGFVESVYLDSLRTINDSLIYYACPNLTLRLFTNDPQWSKQSTMGNNTMALRNLNVEKAWDFILANGGTISDITTKVGLIDDGVWGKHADLFGNGNFNGQNGSNVRGFLDYQNGVPASAGSINSVTGPHGTAMAGYIAAFRDNNTGIAGIAGGDWDNPDPSKRDGAEIWSIQAIDAGSQATQIRANFFADALSRLIGLNASTPLPIPIPIPLPSPYVDMVNLSLGYNLDDFLLNGGTASTIPAIEALFRDQTRVLHRFSCPMICSRGHKGNFASIQNLGFGEVFPATVDDKWVISVGGADLTGDLAKKNTASFSRGDVDFQSYYGKGMDFLAPGINYNFSGNAVSESLWFNGVNSSSSLYTSSYTGPSSATPGGGTSMSAAYTTGTCALLKSWANYRGFSLYAEDYEKLLEYGAADVNNGNGSTLPGYDVETGWGNVDVEATVKLLSPIFPEGRLLHGQISPNAGGQLIASNKQVRFPYPSSSGIGGVLTVDVYKYTATKSITLPTGFDFLSVGPGLDRPGYWARNSSASSNLGAEPTLVPGQTDLVFPEVDVKITVTQQQGSQVTLQGEGYYYIVKNGASAGQVFPQVSGSTKPKIGYTLLIREISTTGTSFAEFEGQVELYPNPANDLILFSFSGGRQNISLTITSLDGKIIKQPPTVNHLGGRSITKLDISDLAGGFYLLEIGIGDSKIYKRIIKQ